MIVSLALVVSVAICMVFLAFFAGVGANGTVFVSSGLGLLMVAALFAAISALGPKFRPTPLLTPTMAGTIGAAVMTLAIIVTGNLDLHAQRAAQRQSAPPPATSPAPVVPSEVTLAPAPSPPPVQSTPPVQSAPPVVEMTPAMPMAPEPRVPPARMAAPAQNVPPEEPGPLPESVESVLVAPAADIAPTGVEEPADAAILESGAQAALAPAGPPAQVPIPLPPIPPRLPAPSDALVLSEEAFDPSSTSTVANTPFIPTPPLPRSRPCGEDGPPCP